MGGAESMLARLVGALDASRFDNRVLSLRSVGPIGEQIRRSGIPVRALGLQTRPTALWNGLAEVRRFHPDIIQTWLYHADLFGLLGRLAAPSSRLLWNVRCSNMDSERYRWLTRLAAVLSAVPNGIVVNSEVGRGVHERLGYRPRQWHLIPNGIDAEIFRPDAADRQAVRRELGIGPDELLIGLPARVDPMKDHATFQAAAAAMPEARYILLGRGTERLPNGLGERADMPRLLRGLDIATLSSAFGEGFPNVLAEAMASGVPCVATDVGDAATIIGETGIVVPPRDPVALRGAWRDLAQLGRDGRIQLGRRARERVESRYSLATIVGRYEALYLDTHLGRETCVASPA